MITLQSGQADIVISDIYATKEGAKAADFITYSKVFDGVLVAKGNPKGITGINETLCGRTAAENTGYDEVPLIQAGAGDDTARADAQDHRAASDPRDGAGARQRDRFDADGPAPVGA